MRLICPRGRRPGLALVPCAWLLLVLAGCVERRYTIRTDPPGALAIVNQEEIGPTPISRSFTFYGDRDIVLIKEGYQTQHIVQPITPAWWDSLATEFFTENLIPLTFRDEREYFYQMVPATNPPINDVVERGDTLRSIGQTAPPPRRGGVLGFFGF